MKRYRISFSHVLPVVFLLILFFNGCKTKTTETLSTEDFRNPPENSKVYAWWHWVDKGISREGITRDLESMKRQGITGVTILNVGQLISRDPGVPKVTFASPEWFDMFKWALHEANRLVPRASRR